MSFKDIANAIVDEIQNISVQKTRCSLNIYCDFTAPNLVIQLQKFIGVLDKIDYSEYTECSINLYTRNGVHDNSHEFYDDDVTFSVIQDYVIQSAMYDDSAIIIILEK